MMLTCGSCTYLKRSTSSTASGETVHHPFAVDCLLFRDRFKMTMHKALRLGGKTISVCHLLANMELNCAHSQLTANRRRY